MTNESCMLYVCNNTMIRDQLNRKQSTQIMPKGTLFTIFLDEFEREKGEIRGYPYLPSQEGQRGLTWHIKISHKVHPICK